MNIEIAVETLISQWNLKDQVRTGWEIRGVPNPESVADHSWGTAMLCMMFATVAPADRDRSIRMALVHDLAEAIVGDIPRRVVEGMQPVSREEKAMREHGAIETLAEADSEIRDLWEEYEQAESPEARFVRDMNLVDMCLQATVYERRGDYDEERTRQLFPDFERLDEFFATSEPRLSTAVGRRLFGEVRRCYEQARQDC